MPENLEQPASLTITKKIAESLERGELAAVVTVARGPNVGAKLLVDEAGQVTGTLGEPEIDSLVAPQAAKFLQSRDETRLISLKDFATDFPSAGEIFLLFERLQPAPRLVVCGAGHVGASLAKLGVFLGYQTTLIDDRAEFLTADRFAGEAIELVVASDWITAVRDVVGNGRGASVAVVTRGHSEDEQCMRAVVQAKPDYMGLIGSKRRTSIVIDRLRESGVGEEELQRIRAPIGLDIGAVSPEEVALAIIAEIVAERRGAAGGSLSAWRRQQSHK
ncbi:MAG TPA: XdhC/CoxI family protein [Pyrinomonadaceae bacterium]|jgi:xanthine dehydrogenase accessory factor